jgi:hypothetical protein
MNLYQLPQAVRDAIEDLCDEQGEISPDAEARLDALQVEHGFDYEAVFAALQEREALAAAAKAEAKRVAEIAARYQRQADRLDSFLVQRMDMAKLKRLRTKLGTIWPQDASRPSIRWSGGGDIPTEFQRVKTLVELDSDKALEEWKRAGELPAGFEVSRSRSIRVR